MAEMNERMHNKPHSANEEKKKKHWVISHCPLMQEKLKNMMLLAF